MELTIREQLQFELMISKFQVNITIEEISRNRVKKLVSILRKKLLKSIYGSGYLLT